MDESFGRFSVVREGEQFITPEAKDALDRLGFVLGEDGIVIQNPEFILYRMPSGKEIKCEVVSLLQKPEELIDGAPAVAFMLKNRLTKLPIESVWLGKWL